MNAIVPIKALNLEPWSQDEKTRLAPVTADIGERGLTCLIGDNGTSLSLYLRALGGVDDLRSGELFLFGETFTGISQEQWQQQRLKLGFVSRYAPLLSVLNGLENVILPVLYHKRMSREEATAAARVLLLELECQADLGVLPAYLTPLERTQLAIARAAILEPQVMLLEDPFHELELIEYNCISQFLTHWATKRALLVSTANLSFVKRHAARIIFAGSEKIHYFDSWRELAESGENTIRDYLQRYREYHDI